MESKILKSNNVWQQRMFAWYTKIYLSMDPNVFKNNFVWLQTNSEKIIYT